MKRSPLPKKRVLLNPRDHGKPLIPGLNEPYYLDPMSDGLSGVVCDAHGSAIGIIEASGDYWRDGLTGREWDSWFCAAHVYLLSLVGDPKEMYVPDLDDGDDPVGAAWSMVRTKFLGLRKEHILTKPVRQAIIGLVRRMDNAVKRRDEQCMQ